jgi:hypothetical protein
MVSFVRLGPRSTPKEMALTSQLSQAVKAAAIEKINDVVDRRCVTAESRELGELLTREYLLRHSPLRARHLDEPHQVSERHQ